MNISFVQITDAVIKVNEIIQSQNVELYKIGYKNNLDNINKKYINLNLFNLLNILAALMETHNKLKLNLKIKNAKII